MNESPEPTLPCPVCRSGELNEPATIEESWQFIPVRRSNCTFTGRRSNLVIIPDSEHGQSWKQLGLDIG